jgi:hypothetical protein
MLNNSERSNSVLLSSRSAFRVRDKNPNVVPNFLTIMASSLVELGSAAQAI